MLVLLSTASLCGSTACCVVIVWQRCRLSRQPSHCSSTPKLPRRLGECRVARAGGRRVGSSKAQRSDRRDFHRKAAQAEAQAFYRGKRARVRKGAAYKKNGEEVEAMEVAIHTTFLVLVSLAGLSVALAGCYLVAPAGESGEPIFSRMHGSLSEVTELGAGLLLLLLGLEMFLALAVRKSVQKALGSSVEIGRPVEEEVEYRGKVGAQRRVKTQHQRPMVVAAAVESAGIVESTGIDDPIKLQTLHQDSDDVEVKHPAAATVDQNERVWSREQQCALDAALRACASIDFASSREKWEAIGAHVPGKAALDCQKRHRKLALAVAEAKRISSNVQFAESAAQISADAALAENEHLPLESVPKEQWVDEGNDGPSETYDHTIEIELQLVPPRGSIRIELSDLTLRGVGTAQPECFGIVTSCNRCRCRKDVTLSMDVRERGGISWNCERCGCESHVLLRPCLVHSASNLLGCFETEGQCNVVEIRRLDLRAHCISCGWHEVFTDVRRGRRADRSCTVCHVAMGITARNFHLEVVEESRKGRAGSGTSTECHAGKRLRAPKRGPLPDLGACKHFRRSLRHLRFPCCGKAFPCPVCHAQECVLGGGILANRMLCGKCGAEQVFSTSKPCTYCGFHMGQSGTAGHWEGGKGSRNPGALDRREKRKNKGESRGGVKKTSSKKSDRVGAAGKKVREAKNSARKKS